MADELTNSRAVLQRQNRDAQSAIQDLLSEREQFRQEMIAAQKYGTCLHSELFSFLLQFLLLRSFFSISTFNNLLSIYILKQMPRGGRRTEKTEDMLLLFLIGERISYIYNRRNPWI